MPIHPGLNIVAIRPTLSLLGRFQVGARFILPAAFGKKRIPDKDFFFVRPAAPGKAPFEDFLVRSSLKSSLDQLIVIHSQKSCAARIEKSWVFHPTKVSRRPLSSCFIKLELDPALTFGFAAWSRAQIREGLRKLASSLDSKLS